MLAYLVMMPPYDSEEVYDANFDDFISFDMQVANDYWEKSDPTQETHILLYVATLKSPFRDSAYQCFLLLKKLRDRNKDNTSERSELNSEVEQLSEEDESGSETKLASPDQDQKQE